MSYNVYRHPKAPLASLNYIQDVFKTLSLKNKSLYILGDFNDNLLLKDNKMTKLIKSSKLTQLVNKLTRVTHTSSTLIDLVITNKPSAVLSCDVVPQEIADHDLTSITVDIKKKTRGCLSLGLLDILVNILKIIFVLNYLKTRKILI